ncbi:MAG: peptidyl-tRNA hydrolase, partial [Candidatus Thorarchaeota archaeon]
KSQFRENYFLMRYPDLEFFLSPSLSNLNEILNEARILGLNESIITDAGHTQLIPGTDTVLALGPAPKIYLEKFIEKFSLKRVK